MHQRLGELLTNTEYSDKATDSNGSSLLTQSGDLSTAVHQASEQIQQFSTATQGTTNLLRASSEVLKQTTNSQVSDGQGVLDTAKEAAGSLVSGGLSSLFPLFSGIAKLFGGGPSEPPPLVEYQAPEKQSFNIAIENGIAGDAVYNGSGQARSASFTELALQGLSPGNGSTVPDNSSSGEKRTVGNPAPQITVQVQAMDSRSFLDHSHDIATAVREAMLNMHSLNDVVNDL